MPTKKSSKSKKVLSDSSNKQVLKALVITGKDVPLQKNVSNSLNEDSDTFSSLGTNKIVSPPFDPSVLAFLPENSSELVQVIEAMEINIKDSDKD